MLKSIFLLLLSITIVIQSASKLLIVVQFKANQDFIAKNLCIKKNIENNDCQGCCHLKKQLKEEDNQDKKSLPSTKEKMDESTISIHEKLIQMIPFRLFLFPFSKNFYGFDFYFHLIKPPCSNS